VALTYCEVCGVLIKGGGADVPEGVICDECFSSRQVMVQSDSELVRAEPAPEDKIQFGCPYCSAVLRLAVPPGDRLHVRCPRCSETFYADSDGTVTAQLEGNTTQVLLQEDVGLPNLTPPTGHSGTQPMAALNKTRPLQAMGSGPLAPNLQPSPAGGLELRPTGQLKPIAPPPSSGSNLRASDEGRINLDTQTLKAKTQRFGKGGKKERATGRPKRTTGRTKTGTEKLPRPVEEEPQESDKKSDKPVAKRKGVVPKGKKASERFNKVSSGAIKRAVNRGNELEREEERRALRTALAWGFVLAPAVLALFLGVLVSRDAGLVEPTKPVGRFLHSTGGQGDRAVRAINGLLPPDARIPDLASERPAGTAPVTSGR
jgi:hypothetical protein